MARPLPSEKHRLRAQLRVARAALTEANWQTLSGALCERLLGWAPLQQATNIALFWPLLLRREPDLRPLDEALRAQHKALFYPCMHGSTNQVHWGFAQTRSRDELGVVRGLYEPLGSCPRAHPGQLDLIVVPSLALDDSGYRLGYGAGFYDRVLVPFAPPAITVGLCFQSERISTLPHEAHDRAVDFIATEHELRRAETPCSNRGDRHPL